MARLEGLRVFVIEDEALVAMNLEMILEDLGCRVVGPAMRLERAEEMVRDGVAADAAILDVNLGGRDVFSVAENLAEAGMPLVFATGYDRSGIPDTWSGRPILQKPYTPEDVATCLSRALEDG